MSTGADPQVASGGTRDGQAGTDQLLATKLYVPRPRPILLSRPRLLARLDAGLEGPVTVISAPTGSGKTALLTDWISHHTTRAPDQAASDAQRAIAWLSLDPGDDDPVQFLRYLVAACRRLAPAAGTYLLSLLSGGAAQLPPAATLLTSFINELVDAPAPGILVLDDFHGVSDGRIHDAVSFLVEHLPPQLHLVIATRVDPPLPLARWRAHGALTELRAADLRFTVEEASTFLTDVMRLPLSATDVQLLDERTEGWIAGLQFAALAMRDRTDLAGFVSAFAGSHRFVLDYLVDEVLVRQPPHVQTFLLHTAILDRLCGPLCDALLGDTGSQALLEALEHANLFVVPLDDTRQWYRYHHLFADVLRHRVGSGIPEVDVRMLHSRAAAWHEAHGMVAEALHHSLQAAEYERYALLVEAVGLQLLPRGEFSTLQQWLAPLPSALVRERPRLGLVSAWALAFTAQIDTVANRLDDVERALADGPHSGHRASERDQLDGELLAIRGFVAFRRHEIPAAIALLQQAQPLLATANAHMRGMNLHHLGLARRLRGDLAMAARAFEEAVAIFGASAETHAFALYPLKQLGMIEETRGRLQRAGELYRRARDLVVVGGEPLPAAGHAYACLGRLHYEWNELDVAEDALRRAIQLGTQGGLDQVVAEAAMELALVLQARGSTDECDAMLRAAQDAARRWNNPVLVAQAAAVEARVRLADGHTAAASRWAADARIDREDIGEIMSTHLTYVRLLLATGALDEARRLAERLAAHAEGSDRMRAALDALALLTVAWQRLGETTAALTTLEHALGLAEADGYIRTFVDAGPTVAALLDAGLAQRDWGRGASDRAAPLHTYARRLRASFPVEPPTPARAATAKVPAAPSSSVEALTAREREVLRLIAAGKSNGEIAATLVVALSTVKAHINNIFSKLAVTSRTQALVRARELDLL